jgi:hypothetical protein
MSTSRCKQLDVIPNNTISIFFAGVVDTGGNLPHELFTPVANLTPSVVDPNAIFRGWEENDS